MALDALRLYVTMYPQMDKGYMVDARETLRQALAQPEQTKYSDIVSDGGLDPRNKFDAQPEQSPKLSDAGADTNIPLWGLEPKGSGMVALHQHEWVGLTLEERQYLNDVLNLNGRFTIIHAIEAKLKEKNT